MPNRDAINKEKGRRPIDMMSDCKQVEFAVSYKVFDWKAVRPASNTYR